MALRRSRVRIPLGPHNILAERSAKRKVKTGVVGQSRQRVGKARWKPSTVSTGHYQIRPNSPVTRFNQTGGLGDEQSSHSTGKPVTAIKEVGKSISRTGLTCQTNQTQRLIRQAGWYRGEQSAFVPVVDEGFLF